MDALHLRFQLHFADHVRLTRDLAALDLLLAEVRGVVAEVEAASPAERPAAWQRVLDTAERRLATYDAARGAIAQAQSVAGLRDRDASVLTGRARLVLHRYVRHFAGQNRRSRDPSLLAEIVADLNAIQEHLKPMAGRIQVPSVAEEMAAVVEFLAFLHAEQGEVEEAWRSGSRLDQSASLAEVARDLVAAWQLHVDETEPTLRRPALASRLVAGLDRVLEALMTLRHANMPDEHEQRIAKVARLLVRWQDVQATTEGLRAGVDGEALRNLLVARADGVFAKYREQLTGDHALRNRKQIQELCDMMDEIERQLSDLEQAAGPLAAWPEVAWVRDVLVAMERTFDQVLAAKTDAEEPGGEL